MVSPLFCICSRQCFKDLCSVPFSSNMFRGKSAFFMSLALKLHRLQLFLESGYASKDLSPFFFFTPKYGA